MDVSEQWNSVADGWDRLRDEIGELSGAIEQRVLREIGPLGTRRVLELAAGTGQVAARLAATLESGGSLVTTDLAERMVARLAARVAGLPGVEVAQVDARSIPYPAASFDDVVIQMGLMLVPEVDLALSEIRRVTRRGGRFVAAVWAGPQHNPWLTSVGMPAMMQGLVPGGPPIGPGGPFSLGDPDDLDKRVRGAGFTAVEIHTVDSSRLYRDADHLFDMVSVLAPPLAAALGSAAPEQLHAVRRGTHELTAQFRTDDGLRMPYRALVCVATA